MRVNRCSHVYNSPKYQGCGCPRGTHNSPATEFKKGNVPRTKGQRFSAELRAKLSAAKLGKPAPHKAGPNCPFWRGGVTPAHLAFRMSSEYANWRRRVFERDNFACVHCVIRGGKLEADHILPFSSFPDLRLDLNNGRTLCVDCHKQTETYGRKHARQLSA